MSGRNQRGARRGGRRVRRNSDPGFRGPKIVAKVQGNQGNYVRQMGQLNFSNFVHCTIISTISSESS